MADTAGRLQERRTSVHDAEDAALRARGDAGRRPDAAVRVDDGMERRRLAEARGHGRFERGSVAMLAPPIEPPRPEHRAEREQEERDDDDYVHASLSRRHRTARRAIVDGSAPLRPRPRCGGIGRSPRNRRCPLRGARERCLAACAHGSRSRCSGRAYRDGTTGTGRRDGGGRSGRTSRARTWRVSMPWCRGSQRSRPPLGDGDHRPAGPRRGM